MSLFELLGKELNYKDILQLDGAFSVAHINYDQSPIFNGIDSKDIARNSRKNGVSLNNKIDDIYGCLHSFDGTEKNYKKEDRIQLWKIYWLEYINAFDRLCGILPDSVVTINVGRQAVEIGFKYLIVKKNGEIRKSDRTHNLSELADTVFKEYSINDDYMKWVDVFCYVYNEHIENGYVEYFRFPEYKNSEYFDGVFLDIDWLSYNFSLILLKLMHFAGIDDEIE